MLHHPDLNHSLCPGTAVTSQMPTTWLLLAVLGSSPHTRWWSAAQEGPDTRGKLRHGREVKSLEHKMISS